MRPSRTNALTAVAALAAAAMIGGTVVMADGGPAPTTTPQAATFTASPSGSVTTTTCTGTDGQYAETSALLQGTMTGASDPRLDGPIAIDLTTFVNTTTGAGTTSGQIRWYKSSNMQEIGRGWLIGVNTAAGAGAGETNDLHGFIRAKLHPIKAVKSHGTVVTPGSPATTLFANFEAASSANDTWSGELGGTTADDRSPAVLQDGTC
jgi:hypothetical protein